MTASITLKVVSFKPPKPGQAVTAAANEPGSGAPDPVAGTVKK